MSRSSSATERKPTALLAKRLGPYLVLEPIARGGMAEVYRGVHQGLGRDVAIKKLAPDRYRSSDAVARFRREAQALAKMRHRNIIGLYDFIESPDGLFMVLELADGPTLAELLSKGALPPEVAAAVAAGVARALEHAHLVGLLHRDVKPGNVVVTRSGDVKLMDFGIARNPDLPPLTTENVFVGTPAYMAPEQISLKDVDGRTDLYSLGVVLYECLCGQKAFGGADPDEVFLRILKGRPSNLARLAPGTPRPLQKLVTRAMRKRPAGRHPSATAMRADLEAFLREVSPLSEGTVLRVYLSRTGYVPATEVHAQLTEKERRWALRIGRRPAQWPRYLATATLLSGAGALAAYAWRDRLATLRWPW